jgi:hypothetical protein
VKKKYDPLWEVVNEKIGLQGQVVGLDVICPHCHVVVHLDGDAKAGDHFCCGLCGASFVTAVGMSKAVLVAKAMDQPSGD